MSVAAVACAVRPSTLGYTPNHARAHSGIGTPIGVADSQPADRDYDRQVPGPSAMHTNVRRPDFERQNRKQSDRQQQEQRSCEVPTRGRLFVRLSRFHLCSAVVGWLGTGVFVGRCDPWP